MFGTRQTCVLAAMHACELTKISSPTYALAPTKGMYTYNQHTALQVGQPDGWNNGCRMRPTCWGIHWHAAEVAGRVHKAYAQLLPGAAYCAAERFHHAHWAKQEFV